MPTVIDLKGRCKRVLVTGGLGFLGQHLIRALASAGVPVSCVDVNRPLARIDGVDYYEGDFCSKHFMEEILGKCDVVFHLASTTLPKTSNDDPQFDVATNLLGTVELLELAVGKGVRKFVFISSGGTVYGVPESVPISETHATNPICSYGIVKLSIEKYLRLFHGLYGLDTVSLRLSNPFGEQQRVDRAQGAIGVFCHKALRGEAIEIWGDGEIVRDFVYVRDAVDAMLATLTSECSGMEINIGSGYGTSLNQVLNVISDLLGREVERRYCFARSFDVPVNYLDIARARETLAWVPRVGLVEGISRVLAWIEAVGDNRVP